MIFTRLFKKKKKRNPIKDLLENPEQYILTAYIDEEGEIVIKIKNRYSWSNFLIYFSKGEKC